MLGDFLSQENAELRSRLLAGIVEQAGEAILVIDPEGIVRYVNRYYEVSSGYRAAEVLGKVASFLNSSFHPESFYQHLWETIRSGKIWSGMIVDRHKDGSHLYMDTTIFAVKDAGGEVIGYGVVQRDVSDQAIMEQNRQRQIEELRALYEISQSLAGTVDLNTTLQLIADACSRLVPDCSSVVVHLLEEGSEKAGREVGETSEAAGRTLIAAAVAGPQRPPSQERMNLRLGQGVAGLALALGTTINVRDVTEDPRYLPPKSKTMDREIRSLMVAPIMAEGKLLGTLSVESPIPAAFSAEQEGLLTTLASHAALAIDKAKLYHELQAALQYEQAARAQLVQSEKLAALGRIIASVAHEMNNPLQAIQNALYLIRMEESLSPQAQEDLQTVLTETERMVELIARLRDTYRPVSREQFEDASLNKLALEVQRLLATQLRHQHIELDFQPDPNLPAVPMIAAQIKQVILNICMNAIDAMPEGGKLSIRTGITRKPQAGVEISIQDSGPGIAPDILPYIFEHFITTKESGTGLGLSISYDIVQRHNGKIDVETAPGQGALFRVWLPLQQVFSEEFPQDQRKDYLSWSP